MYGKISIDVDFDNAPLIKVKSSNSSDDLRDKILNKFVEPIGHPFNWLRLSCIDCGGNENSPGYADYEIQRIPIKNSFSEIVSMMNYLSSIFILGETKIKFETDVLLDPQDVPKNKSSYIREGLLNGFTFERPEGDEKYPQGHYFPWFMLVNVNGIEYKVDSRSVLSINDNEVKIPSLQTVLDSECCGSNCGCH